MCCYGKSDGTRKRPRMLRAAMSVRKSLQDAPFAPNGVVMEYIGRPGLLVQGTLTGKLYRFAGRGKRVRVDARDLAFLEKIPTLRRTVEVG